MFLIRVPRTAHAGADGVDLGIDRGDGNFRAIASLGARARIAMI